MVNSKTKSIPADLGMNLFTANVCDVSINNVPYRQVGCLMFLSNVTCPDIVFIVNRLSRFVTCFSKQHWCAVKNIFRYLSVSINQGILYDGTNENPYPEGFSVSDYAADIDTRRSTTGYVFKLVGDAIT